jgi:signal transduction histidine kinase
VVRNFVSNALKFSPNGSTVLVNASFQPLSDREALLSQFDADVLDSIRVLTNKKTLVKYDLVGLLVVGFRDSGVGIDEVRGRG